MRVILVKNNFYSLLLLIFLSLLASNSMAHGGVAIEDDNCVVQLKDGRVHFSAYQPETTEGSEYCNLLPTAEGKTIVVLDLVEKSLRAEGVGLRIFAPNDAENMLVEIKQKPLRGGVLEATFEFPSSGRYIAEIFDSGESKARIPLDVDFTDWPREIGLFLYNLARLAIVGYLLYRLFKYIKRKLVKNIPVIEE